MVNTYQQYWQNTLQTRWQRSILLIVLAYEAAGCFTGGALLVASPNGSYMNMPVSLLQGTFNDFLVPGFLLIGLGILNTIAFVSVLHRTNNDWLWAGLALGGLLIWFIVEIIILQQLHWLHLMWGYPVLVGWAVAIPLIVLRNDTSSMRKALLSCGILSSAWYVAISIFVPMLYEGYDQATFTVSELSAIGAPTRIAWVLLALFYPLFLVAFGWGVLAVSKGNHKLRVAGSLIIVYGVLNFYWPPMHQREVIGAGGGTITDSLHIIWAMITLLFNMLLMGFGKAALGKSFRIYTMITWVIFIVFGFLTFLESPGIEANLPTPYIGLWELINMGVFMLWMVVFSINLLQKERTTDEVLFSEEEKEFRRPGKPDRKGTGGMLDVRYHFF